MTYTIPDVPPSNNRYIGRNARWDYQEEKRRWCALVLAAVGRNRPEEPLRYARVTLRYYFPTRGRRDPDNYAGKMLLDGLTHAGVIADDSFDHIELRLCGAYDKQNPRTEIEITAMVGETVTADAVRRIRNAAGKAGDQDYQ